MSKKLFEVTGTWYSQAIPIVAVVEAEDGDEAYMLAKDGEVELDVKSCAECNGSGFDTVSFRSFSIKRLSRGNDVKEILQRKALNRWHQYDLADDDLVIHDAYEIDS